MFYILYTLIIGISFSQLLLPKLDVWHSSGIFAQGCIMLMFAYSFFETRKPILFYNKPFGMLNIWIGLSTLFICYHAQASGRYDVKHFFPYFNFLCLGIMYQVINTQITRAQIEKILESFRYVVIATLLLAVLQHFNLSQFFHLISTEGNRGEWHNNPVVGFSGNPTHFSGYLGLCSPIFLWKRKRLDWLCIALMLLLMCFTGTTKGDPAISGFIVLAVVFAYTFKNKKIIIIPLFLLFALLTSLFAPENFLSLNGRGQFFPTLIGYFKQLPITGHGLGSIEILYLKGLLGDIKHAHLECLGYALEIGLIGLILILNLIHKFIIYEDDTRIELVLKSIVLGFLVSCLFNSTSHLWLPSIITMFAYASYFCIKNEKALTDS